LLIFLFFFFFFKQKTAYEIMPSLVGSEMCIRDRLCLAAGYGWLAIGLLLYGAALAAGRYQTTALHIIMVGALGTLTLNVMAMTWTLKARQDPSRARVRVGATILIGTAALTRALAGLAVFDPQVLLVIAATAWSSAFALLLVLFVRLRTRTPAD